MCFGPAGRIALEVAVDAPHFRGSGDTNTHWYFNVHLPQILGRNSRSLGDHVGPLINAPRTLSRVARVYKSYVVALK